MKLITKTLTYIFALYLSMSFFKPVMGLEQTSIYTTPSQGTISGASQGDKSSLDISFDLKGLSNRMIISSVYLKFNMSGTNSSYFKFTDKYSERVLASTTPVRGSNSINIPIDLFNSWLSNPNQNMGIFIKAIDLNANDSVQLTSIHLEIYYSVPDATPPELTDMIISNLTNTGVTFQITSNKPAFAHINYGKTSNYTLTSIKENLLTLEHTILLTDLEQGVTYHYQICLTDNSGNEYKSSNYTFITKYTPGTISGMQESSVLPIPGDIQLILVSDEPRPYVTVNWKNLNLTKEIDGYIIFRSTDLNQNFAELNRVSESEKYEDKTVETGKTYYYYIQSYSENQVSIASPRLGILVTNKTSITVTTGTPQDSDSRTNTLLFVFAIVGIVVFIYYIILKAVNKIIDKVSDSNKKDKSKPKPFDGIFDNID